MIPSTAGNFHDPAVLIMQYDAMIQDFSVQPLILRIVEAGTGDRDQHTTRNPSTLPFMEGSGGLPREIRDAYGMVSPLSGTGRFCIISLVSLPFFPMTSETLIRQIREQTR